MVRVPEIIFSLAFHAGIVLLAVASVPFLSRDLSPPQPILTVEVVNKVPETNLNEGSEAVSKPPPKPKRQPEPETPAKQDPQPAPPKPEPKPTPETAAIPIPEAQPKPESKPVPPPKARPKAPPKTVAAPPKRPKHLSPDYKKRQEQQKQVTAKLKDLAEREAARKKQQEDRLKKKKQAQDKLAKILASNEQEAAEKPQDAEDKIEDIIGEALNTQQVKSSPLGVSDIDKLRNHIAPCWNPPAGTIASDALIIDIIVRLNPQAEVIEVEIKDKARLESDSVFRAAARAVQRAMGECSPLPLPLPKYNEWKELSFSFDPRFITRS